jgi:hypothetical protein
MPGISYRGRPHRGGAGILIRSLSPDDVDEISAQGVAVLQGPIYAEEQTRPTVYQQPAPGGVFQTILTVNITTTDGNALDIEAELSALTDGGAASTNTEAGIRIIVDGVSNGMGSFQTSVNDNNNLEPFIAVSLVQRVPLAPLVLAPGPHVVELQWMIQGDGAGDKLIGFLVPDQDGCSMRVSEVLVP